MINFTGRTFPVELVTHKLFNENADNHTFMALAELLSITTLLSVMLLLAVCVCKEEEGTWDIMLLMPVNAKIIILAKVFFASDYRDGGHCDLCGICHLWSI